MNERTIAIPLDEYNELVSKAERIAAVERMFLSGGYVSTDDIKPVLGIDSKKV